MVDIDIQSIRARTMGKARPGHEADVELVRDVLREVHAEPATAPWFGVRLSKRVVGIVERVSDEGDRHAHLLGRGVGRLMAHSNALLAKPAEISKLDMTGERLG